jgi:ribonuclease PH
MARHEGRANSEVRKAIFVANYYKHTLGSCFARCGNTQVICAASVEERVPPFLRNTKTGWITAEYGMLPCSCSERTEREAVKGKQSGRTLEIQRLISRALRSVVDLSLLGERQIKIDCDVVQADGGTRTTSINGAFVALYSACEKLVKTKKITKNPVKDHVVAISCGVVNNAVLVDLDYSEDSSAKVDSNFVMSSNEIIEIQACGEQNPFTEKELNVMFDLAKKARDELIQKQKEALGL